MNRNDKNVLLYLSIMFVILVCFGLFFSLIFVDHATQPLNVYADKKPIIILISGVIVASMSGLAGNVIADYIKEYLSNKSAKIKYLLPLSLFFITLLLSIWIALASQS